MDSFISGRDPGDETDYVAPTERQPVCGEDFCDRCGDCLHCYGGDPCYDGGSHMWVKDDE